MIIGIDIDDTITDTYEVMFNYAQEFTANILKREPIIKELENCKSHFYTRELHEWPDGQDIAFFELYYERILQTVKPKTLAIDYLRKLHDEGNTIVLITARWVSSKLDVETITKQWLQDYAIPFDKLIINAEDKLVVAKQENIDVFIDDSFHNCKMISDNGIQTYIMDTRVNRGLSDTKIKRVYSWPHLYMCLQECKR